ncbi:MAG: hypothetical protein MUE52_14595 [Tabrizicola sp.]|jgi:hypothetical protein|nr:hypothetical protein [Tabrizicola sp.]
MDALLTVLAVMVAGYALPLLMPGWRWLAGLAAAGALAGLGVWFAWVDRQTDGLAAGVAALLTLSVAAVFALGLAVRALVLWRGWTGGRAALAITSGTLIWLSVIFWLIWTS